MEGGGVPPLPWERDPGLRGLSQAGKGRRKILPSERRGWRKEWRAEIPGEAEEDMKVDINPKSRREERSGDFAQRPPRHDGEMKDEPFPRRNDFLSGPGFTSSDPGSDSESENSSQESKLESDNVEDEEDEEEEEEEAEEAKRYISEKVILANRLLESEEPVDENRERKLKFKEKLVDLEVPPPPEGTDLGTKDSEIEGDVSGKISQLHISNEIRPESILLSFTNGSSSSSNNSLKDGQVLVERSGKFELLNLQDVESQGFLPPIGMPFSKTFSQEEAPRSSCPTAKGPGRVRKDRPSVRRRFNVFSSSGEPLACFPQPASNPKHRPSSAVNTARSGGNRKSPRRAKSASISSVNSTYCLSPRQKERQRQLELQKEELRKAEEERKREEEEMKKKENELVFKAWLLKKKGQVLEERRIQRAKEMEDMNSRLENRDPQEAFRLWLKKKQEEQMKDKQIEDLKRQEECLFFLKGAESRDRAFKQWLRRKRVEKQAEQQAAREQARRHRIEARRVKQLQHILSAFSEMTAFRFTDKHS
ncbi:coiled-coil domain-containing protein 181 isoform X2 [Tachyglossus aculeatus]|uniref:coiled-coil domain-containing protein 181 isoform X2 n=1 Tax=Tachyglossus aculeatus TaxID=9261 RepID=UPI0018F611CC|nr:coiled-coil domain-containing protein 181 isoform X2 [Tachyglossus aculeatus]